MVVEVRITKPKDKSNFFVGDKVEAECVVKTKVGITYNIRWYFTSYAEGIMGFVTNLRKKLKNEYYNFEGQRKITIDTKGFAPGKYDLSVVISPPGASGEEDSDIEEYCADDIDINLVTKTKN